MEANTGFVERLTTMRVLAEVGKKLQAKQDVFITVGTELNFAVVVVVVMAYPSHDNARLQHRQE